MPKEFEGIVALLLIVSLLFVVFSIAIIVSIFRYKQKQQKYVQEKATLQSQFAQSLLESQLEIREQTLKHIAYELHDNLGQIASLIKINLNTLHLDDPVKKDQKIEDTKELVRQMITDLKSLSVSLNSDWVARQGIEKCLENEADRLRKTGQFTVSLDKTGSVPVLDTNTTIILYRMAQETINNIVKHSSAKQIGIFLKAEEKLITLVLSDDGVGFDKEEKMKNGGSGLMNLKNRAALINARVDIQSSPGKGTTISIALPL